MGALMPEIEKAVELGERANALLDRALALRMRRRVRESDRVAHFLQSSFVFRQSENLQNQLIFNVPKGFSFEAQRLALYPEVRIVSIEDADGDSEITFRPTLWTNAIAVSLTTASLAQAFDTPTDRLVDATVQLTQVEADGVTTHDLQNAPFPVAHAFSAPVNSDLGGAQLISARPGKLVFAAPITLAPGTAFAARITPTFSGVRTADTRLNEYRIVGVLEGFKRLGSASA